MTTHEGNGKHKNTRRERLLRIRRRSRLLAFIGALIVFVTFVVKEGIRDHLRDLSESINTAENTFLLRNDTIELPISFGELTVGINELKEIGESPNHELPGSNQYSESMRREAILVDTTVQSMKAEVDSLTRAIKLVGPNDELSRSLDLVKLALQTEGDKGTKFANEVQEKIGTDSTADKMALPEAEYQTVWTLTQLEYIRTLGVQPLEKRIIEVAEEKSARYEKFYNRATWWSYGLYALGWTLGLIGRVFGVEGLTPAE